MHLQLSWIVHCFSVALLSVVTSTIAGMIDNIVFLCVFAASDHVLPHKRRDLIGYALSQLHGGAVRWHRAE